MQSLTSNEESTSIPSPTGPLDNHDLIKELEDIAGLLEAASNRAHHNPRQSLEFIYKARKLREIIKRLNNA